MIQITRAVRSTRRFSRRILATALAIAVGAFVVVATVSDRTAHAQEPQPKAPEFTITLATTPNPPVAGTIDFEVTVQGPDKKPVVGGDVSLRLTMPGMPGMRGNVVALKAAEGKAADEGKYVGQGRASMAGMWDATIAVKVGGKDVAEKKLTFTAK